MQVHVNRGGQKRALRSKCIVLYNSPCFFEAGSVPEHTLGCSIGRSGPSGDNCEAALSLEGRKGVQVSSNFGGGLVWRRAWMAWCFFHVCGRN